MYENLVPRFLNYVKFETRSDETSTTVPSTQNQVAFAKQVLMPELEALGLSDIQYNPANGFVTAVLPANSDKPFPKMGFIAHMDTADFEAANVNPIIRGNYDGKAIVLDAEKNIVLSPDDFPALKNYVGQTLITTDGKTLLGADDKAGIAEIMTAMEIVLAAKDIEHGVVKVAFGPDEEIGRGADLFDVAAFDCDFAYTMDGGPVGELEFESFNAAQAIVRIQGKNVHPGTAKDTMVNAIKLALAFDDALPQEEVPEKTEKREGFYHLMGIEGNVEESKMVYIIRDHDRVLFEEKKAMLRSVADLLNSKLKEKRISIEISDQYFNMGEILEKDMRPVSLAESAMKALGIVPIIEPIRGGTDGSKLSYMGLPTPNIFAGGENFHGRYEFVSIQSMEKATAVIVEIIRQSQGFGA
ncbi:peptidase m20 [Trichococcus palustris]|jgi:tripeptide aminopeptidase|uniref:Peptidase T n=1 Tax=Trichococcus palustris TaxID=140314 RepID=A0A143YBL3_9LACT|nr:peptidase T [Trichococcus palustris]CZQ84861.1 peptidase m20 [Trichococcus palustris]SFK54187.1 tripeptide aminopeptidase [Trichococcus palustris]